MGSRDVYSGFGFYTALIPLVYSAAAVGETIDLLEFDAVTFVVATNSCDSATANSAADTWKFHLQHGLASATGVSTWSLVPNSQLIHSVYGGYFSTGETGLFQYGFASTCGTSGDYNTFAVGYKKDTLHRYVRLYVSISGSPSTVYMGALAFAGYPSNWPVNAPIDN